MKCNFCNNEVPPGAANCPSCGAAFPQPVQQPPVNAPGAQYAQPVANVPAGYEQKSRVVYILLGLSLGCFGIHNFYAGYSNRGLIQLLITLIFGIFLFPLIIVSLWALFELLIVKKDANSVPMK